MSLNNIATCINELCARIARLENRNAGGCINSIDDCPNNITFMTVQEFGAPLVGHVNANNGFYITGSATGSIPVEGAGARLLFYPGKGGAFRAGQVDGTQWNDANIGEASAATGTNNIAAGSDSHAEGSGTQALANISHAEGYQTIIDPAFGTGSHTEGFQTQSLGAFNHAEGYQTGAWGDYSHAEGFQSTSFGAHSHAEGFETYAFGIGSHAEGFQTIAQGNWSHAEGFQTLALGNWSHAEGKQTVAFGDFSHAQGDPTYAYGSHSMAEGFGTTSIGFASHAAGYQTLAMGYNSFSQGSFTAAIGSDSHSQGIKTVATNIASHAQGVMTTSSGYAAHAQGFMTTASGSDSHSQGHGTNASGLAAHAEGYMTTASGDISHAEGFGTVAYGLASHSEGESTIASGINSHAQGLQTTSSGFASHAEGFGTVASAQGSHSEGYFTLASGFGSHAEGDFTIASGDDSHAEGLRTVASAPQSHAQGLQTTANSFASFATGNFLTTNGITGLNLFGLNGTGYILPSNTLASSSIPAGTVTLDASYGLQLAHGNAFMNTSNGYGIGLVFGLNGGASARPDIRGICGGWHTALADYAEYFEWADGNPTNEDRIGNFVSLVGEKIEIANNKANVIGITSATSGFIGDTQDLGWGSTNLYDDFGRLITSDSYSLAIKDYLSKNSIKPTNELNQILESKIDKSVINDVLLLVPSDHVKNVIDIAPKKINVMNPLYDPHKSYIPRSMRKEWIPVGLMGKIFVKDDGTCKVGERCSLLSNGTATQGDQWPVLSRTSANVIRILFK